MRRNFSSLLVLLCLAALHSSSKLTRRTNVDREATAAQPGAAPAPSAPVQRMGEIYGRLPLSFEENRGQTDPQVKFLSRGNNYGLFLTSTEAVLALKGEPDGEKVLRLTLVGANPGPQVKGVDELPGKNNYFIGNDSSRWRANVPTYAKVQYKQVYPDVDLIYYGRQRRLEYDFVLSPGADPALIRLAVAGADEVKIDGQGDLVLRAGAGEARLNKPFAYQEFDGLRKEVACNFTLEGENEVGFEVEDYDPARVLVIDPILLYSTYLGGSGGDDALDIDVDSSGNAYVVGYTTSTDFPIVNPRQSRLSAGYDVFVMKLAASGESVYYSTYLGGSDGDYGFGIAVDSSGSACVTGNTLSANFPTANARQPAHGGGEYDAFISKLNLSGNALVYSTYHGGSGLDTASGIAVDFSGAVYVTGYTNSSNFPTANARQPTFGGGYTDAFVTKLNASGTSLSYSTYLGGNDWDQGFAIATDSAGAAYVAGYTYSTNFPTANAPQAVNAGKGDAFITKLSSLGSILVYSTYHGGAGFFIDGGLDAAFGIAVDSLGSAYVTGNTSSIELPTANPLQPANAGGGDAFITKIGEAVPRVEITMSSAIYSDGDVVTATEFRLKNAAAGSAAVELKVSLRFPGLAPVSVLNLGSDGSFTLAAGLNQDLGPITLFTVGAAFPRGLYEFGSQMQDPVTGAVMNVDRNPFVIR